MAVLGEILADEGALRSADSALNNCLVKRQENLLVWSCFLCGKLKQNMLFKIRAKNWHGHFMDGKRICSKNVNDLNH